MNAKTDRWESYTDQVGRRHWRWPATNGQMGAGSTHPDAGTHPKFGLSRQQQAQVAPTPLKDK